MAKEIERKFLVKKDRWEWKDVEGVKGKAYRQGYIPTAKGATVRIRIIKEKKAYLTLKGPTHGFTRSEFEYKIPVADARQMLYELCSDCVEKTRYKVPMNGLIWEVDVFHGENEGLVTVEVELQSEDQEINLPDWVGREVTQTSRYSSSNLARLPYSKWHQGERYED